MYTAVKRMEDGWSRDSISIFIGRRKEEEKAKVVEWSKGEANSALYTRAHAAHSIIQ